MKLMSSYAIKLNGDLKSLETSIVIYREALHFVIPIVNTHWDEMTDFEYANQRMAYAEKLVHTTKDNEARYPFDVKFPNSLRIYAELCSIELSVLSLLIAVTWQIGKKRK